MIGNLWISNNSRARDPEDSGWGEFPGAGYNKIWYSDDDRHSKSTSVAFEYALMLFRFKIGAKPGVLTKIVLSFEGYGTAPSGNGLTIKVWNFTSTRALNYLLDNSYIQRVARGIYQITPKGRGYLALLA